MFTNTKDLKVMWGDKELSVRNVEVSYSIEDLPSVSVEALMPPQRDIEVTMKVEDTAADVIKKMLAEAQMNGAYIGVDRAEEGNDRTDAMAYAYETMKTKEKNMRGYAEDSCEKACDDGVNYGSHNLAKKYVDLSLDDRQKLIRKYNLKQEDGTLTERGRELLLTILFDTYEDEVVEALEELEEQRKADRE